MVEITHGVICKFCRQLVDHNDTLDHLALVHGYNPNFILKNNINAYYTVVPLLSDWPQMKVPKKKKKR